MTRRSPPSKLTFLPSHIPTPPRGAPKYFLPTLPPSMPTVTRPSLSVPLPLPQPHLQALDLEFMEHPYKGYKIAEEGTRPPWVRSRGIDIAEKELGRALERPREVLLGR